MTEMLTIGQIADIYDGPHATPNKTVDGPYFLNIASLQNGRLVLAESAHLSEADFLRWTKRVTPKANDVLFSYETRLGEAALMPAGIKACLGRRMGLLRPKIAKIDPQFLLYSYLGPHFQSEILTNTIKGATVERISVSEIGNFTIQVPSKTEQKKVAGILSAIDAKIDLNNRINAELEALAKAIYDYWFVQFDFPDAKGRPYKFSGGKMVWNEALKREIPVGWDAVVIGQECETILGGTPHTKNPDYWDNADIPWLSSGETASFPVVTSEQKITAAGIRDSAAKLLPAGTVVISIVRYIRPSILGIAAATNQSVAGILETVQFPSSFLYPAVCREVPRWMSLRTGAQQPHINKATIDDTLLVRAPEGVIDAYRKVADPLFNRILVAANENIELTQLRDWLLPLLMNGQVRVA